MTAPDIRTIAAMPKSYGASMGKRWLGYPVEVLPVPADANGALSVRILDGPDEGRELWLHPTLLKLPEIETGGSW